MRHIVLATVGDGRDAAAAWAWCWLMLTRDHARCRLTIVHVSTAGSRLCCGGPRGFVETERSADDAPWLQPEMRVRASTALTTLLRCSVVGSRGG